MAEAVTLREDATPLRDDVAHFGAKARALAPVRRLLLASATPSPAPATRVGVSRSRLAVSATPSSSCASTSRRTSSATSGPTVAAAQPVQRTPTAVTVTTALRTSGISFIQHTPVAGSRGHTLAARFLSSTPLATRAASKPPAFALCAAPACAADEFTYSSSCLTRVPNPSDAACVTSTMQAQPGRMPFSAPGEDSTAEPTATETLPDVTVSDAGNESSAALATVFQECQQYGRAEVLLQLLLEAGASDKRLACGLPSDAVSPLGAAASAGFLDLVQLLIDYGAPVHATPGQKAPLALAAAAGRVHTAALLLSHGADPDEAGTRLGGGTYETAACFLACRLWLGLPTLTWLADCNLLADASFLTRLPQDYRTPLMLAAARGDVAMVALLLDGGASINCSIGGGVLLTNQRGSCPAR